MKKRTKLCSVWSDTASLIVGDPCQLLTDVRLGRRVPTYNDLLGLVFPERPQGDRERVKELLGRGDQLSQSDLKELIEESASATSNKVVTLLNERGGAGAVYIQTGCDGYYPVYLEYDSKGEGVRIVIELGGKVSP